MPDAGAGDLGRPLPAIFTSVGYRRVRAGSRRSRGSYSDYVRCKSARLERRLLPTAGAETHTRMATAARPGVRKHSGGHVNVRVRREQVGDHLRNTVIDPFALNQRHPVNRAPTSSLRLQRQGAWRSNVQLFLSTIPPRYVAEEVPHD